MIILFGFGKDYRAMKARLTTARLLRRAASRPRRMPLADLAKWLSR